MAIVSDIGIPGAGTGYVYQPKFKNRYQAIFYFPDSIYTDAAKAEAKLINAESNIATRLEGKSAYVGTTSSVQALTANCTKFARPTIDFEPVVLHRYNSNIKVSQSKYNFGDINMTVEDDITNLVSQAIQGMLDRQHSLISQGSSPYLKTAATADIYKFRVELEELDGGVNVVTRWNMTGCWFKNLNYGELSYEDGTQATIDITLSVDHVQQDFVTDVIGQALSAGTH
jgi:hypothetical protein